MDLAADAAPTIANLGMRVAVIADPRWAPPGMPQGATPAEYLARTFRQLNEWGFEATLGTLKDRSEGSLSSRLLEAARFLRSGEDQGG